MVCEEVCSGGTVEGYVFVFVCVTTCVLFVTAMYITVFWQQAVLGVEILWQILVVSFLCSVVTFFYPRREVGKKVMLSIYICHYVLTNAIVLGCGIWFEWFYIDNLPMVLAMLLAIAVIFALVSPSRGGGESSRRSC